MLISILNNFAAIFCSQLSLTKFYQITEPNNIKKRHLSKLMAITHFNQQRKNMTDNSREVINLDEKSEQLDLVEDDGESSTYEGTDNQPSDFPKESFKGSKVGKPPNTSKTSRVSRVAKVGEVLPYIFRGNNFEINHTPIMNLLGNSIPTGFPCSAGDESCSSTSKNVSNNTLQIQEFEPSSQLKLEQNTRRALQVAYRDPLQPEAPEPETLDYDTPIITYENFSEQPVDTSFLEQEVWNFQELQEVPNEIDIIPKVVQDNGPPDMLKAFVEYAEMNGGQGSQQFTNGVQGSSNPSQSDTNNTIVSTSMDQGKGNQISVDVFLYDFSSTPEYPGNQVQMGEGSEAFDEYEQGEYEPEEYYEEEDEQTVETVEEVGEDYESEYVGSDQDIESETEEVESDEDSEYKPERRTHTRATAKTGYKSKSKAERKVQAEEMAVANAHAEAQSQRMMPCRNYSWAGQERRFDYPIDLSDIMNLPLEYYSATVDYYSIRAQLASRIVGTLYNNNEVQRGCNKKMGVIPTSGLRILTVPNNVAFNSELGLLPNSERDHVPRRLRFNRGYSFDMFNFVAKEGWHLQYHDNHDIIYEPEYTFFEYSTKKTSKGKETVPRNDTREAVCPYCPTIRLFALKNSAYGNHLANDHGILSDSYVTPDPFVGRKVINGSGRIVICPVCSLEIVVAKSSATALERPLYSYMRHFRKKHSLSKKGLPLKQRFRYLEIL